MSIVSPMSGRLADVTALDPAAAGYVRELADRGLAGALRDHGDTDPTATIASLQRAVATFAR